MQLPRPQHWIGQILDKKINRQTHHNQKQNGNCCHPHTEHLYSCTLLKSLSFLYRSWIFFTTLKITYRFNSLPKGDQPPSVSSQFPDSTSTSSWFSITMLKQMRELWAVVGLHCSGSNSWEADYLVVEAGLPTKPKMGRLPYPTTTGHSNSLKSTKPD